MIVSAIYILGQLFHFLCAAHADSVTGKAGNELGMMMQHEVNEVRLGIQQQQQQFNKTLTINTAYNKP